MSRRSSISQFVFNIEPESRQLRIDSVIFPTIKSMLRSKYDILIRDILKYFHDNYISNDLILDFLKIVQIWDSVNFEHDILDIRFRNLVRTFEDKHSYFMDRKMDWYGADSEYIVERLYVLFVMLFRYKKLEQYRKASIPNVEEFREEWEDILQSSRNHGMELSDIVMRVLEDVYTTRELISDFKIYTNYYKHKFNNLLPNSKNRYELKNLREHRITSNYDSFLIDRRPWLYEFSMDDLLYGNHPSPKTRTKGKLSEFNRNY